MVYGGALAMWMLGKYLKKKYKLKEDPRESLYDDCNKWLEHLKLRGTRFLGGDQAPSLADLAVYGYLTTFEGCQAFKVSCVVIFNRFLGSFLSQVVFVANDPNVDFNAKENSWDS